MIECIRMRLEHYPIEQLKKEIIAIIDRHLGGGQYRVFFFGSRVTGKGTARSDIDIGIEGPEEIPARAMFAIEEEIENLPTLYKIEIVDFRHVPAKFREVALKNTEPIAV